MKLQYRAAVLTLHLQVSLSLEVFHRRMIHDADDGDAVILPADGESQPTGHRVHLIVRQLNSGLPCGDMAVKRRFKNIVKQCWIDHEDQTGAHFSVLRKLQSLLKTLLEL